MNFFFTFEFLSELKKRFNAEYNFNEIQIRKLKHSNCFSYSVGGKTQLKAIYGLLYKNCTYLTRKKINLNKFYKLILNEGELQKFIDWLPDLKVTEKYMIFLFARRKYDTQGVIKSDKAQLKRVLATKDRIIEKIRQMEIAVGGYTVDGVSVPQEALALYITPNPRCLKRAAKTLAKRLVEVICENIDVNPVSEALTAVHQSLGTNYFKDFDYDGVDLDTTLIEVYKVINKSAVHVVLTRGGFHVLVEMSQIEDTYKKIWYQGLTAIAGCDVRGDNLLPLVGCTQGGYEPKLIQ